jgi:branched-chain amino acid transport system substrate-binding protein
VKAMRILELKAPRGPVKFDQFGTPIHNSYLRNVEIVDGAPQNVNFKTYPAVSQFWTWSPEEFMKMTPYADMKGKWAK